MFYYTVPQSPITHQITLEELLSGKELSGVVRTNYTNTRTILTSNYNEKIFDDSKVIGLINTLNNFITTYSDLYEVDRATLYHSYKIPKHSGGLRQIDEPLPVLKSALEVLRSIFQNQFQALYHTSAYAYVPGRSILSALQKHQANDSHWFLKTDLTDFFGSTTKEYTLRTLENIFLLT